MKRDRYIAQEVDSISKYLFLGKVEETPENADVSPAWFADFQRAAAFTKKEARKMFVKVKQAVRGKGMKLQILNINMKLDEKPTKSEVEEPAPKKKPGRPKQEKKAEKPVEKKKRGRPKQEKKVEKKVVKLTANGKKRGRPFGSKNKTKKVAEVTPVVTPAPVVETAPVQVPVVAPVETPVAE